MEKIENNNGKNFKEGFIKVAEEKNFDLEVVKRILEYREKIFQKINLLKNIEDKQQAYQKFQEILNKIKKEDINYSSYLAWHIAIGSTILDSKQIEYLDFEDENKNIEKLLKDFLNDLEKKYYF